MGPYHISREYAYRPDGLHSDSHVSFLARGKDIALLIYDLKEEEG